MYLQNTFSFIFNFVDLIQFLELSQNDVVNYFL